jgi:hypothetical protein
MASPIGPNWLSNALLIDRKTNKTLGERPRVLYVTFQWFRSSAG